MNSYTKDYKDENFWLMFGDCLERMKEIPDNSVDCCVSDIPYGIDFEEWDVLHKNNNSALLGQSPKNKQGSKIFSKRGKPINGWSEEDKQRGKQVQEWAEKWLSELYRVLKPCSPVMIMCGRQFQHRFTCSAEDVGFLFKDYLTWEKPNAPFRAQRVNNILTQRGMEKDHSGDWRLGNLAPVTEPILYLFKPYPTGTTITDQFVNSSLGCFNAEVLTSNLVKTPNRVFEKKHPTQKPVELMEIIVKLVTKEGHSVLDMFSGSATTGEACKNLNRRFIGIEANEHYFSIGKERLLALTS